MKRNATIAITAEGKSNINRLRLPEWHIEDLYIEASGKRSKCYRPEGAPKSATSNRGIDEFNFAPEKETVKLCYKINDPTGALKGGKLELFSRFETKALWSLDLAKLGADWFKHGEHTIKWDGRVIKGANKIDGVIKQHKIEHDLNKEAADTTLDKDHFPDGYITLKNTPYKLKLTLTPADAKNIGNPASSWCYFHILIKKLEIILAEEDLIPAATINDKRHKMDKELNQFIQSKGSVPATGTVRKIPLISNLYKTSSGEMNDNTSYDVYNTLWDKGPQIPLLASVYLADSAGNELKLISSNKGAVALGNTQFLWDWEDVAENVTAQQNSPAPYNAKPKAFINSAINYYSAGTDAGRAAADHTYPKGDNCHVDRGGKRGPSANPIFPPQTGYKAKDTLEKGKFPFKIESCKKRKWASLSTGWSSGKLKGQTGVLFQPSRMGGENYNVSVYLANDLSAKDTMLIDNIAEPLKTPPLIKASTGEWQIWREIHLARYIRKKNTIAAFLPSNLAAVREIFNDAFIDVVDKMHAPADNYLINEHRKADGNAVDYNALAMAKLNASGNPFLTQDIAIKRTDDHASVDSGLKAQTYAQFVQNLHALLHPGIAATSDLANIAAANGLTQTALSEGLAAANLGSPPLTAEIARLITTQAFLNSNGFQDRVRYSNRLDSMAFTIIISMVEDNAQFSAISGAKAGDFPGAKDGVTIIHFNYSNTYLEELVTQGVRVGIINGAAIDVKDAKRNACVFIFTNAMLDTFCHEIGHHMFLPHARFSTSASIPGGAQANRHDDSDHNCMMSYNRPRHAFCGLCQLRLRGWNSDTLDKISANNKKT